MESNENMDKVEAEALEELIEKKHTNYAKISDQYKLMELVV
jgi:hypothetical protein